MSIFRSKKNIVELTDEAYARWLRARSPQPLSFFLGLAESEQEALALLGDEYTQDLCLGIGFAVQDPVGAQAGLDASSAGSGDLLSQLAMIAAQKSQDAPTSDAGEMRRSRPITMGGVTERRQAKQDEAQKKLDESRSFLGRKPDSLEVVR